VATPVLIHRAIFGSLERFLALLVEEHGGHWPFWLSPRQAIILTVNQDAAVVQRAQEAAAKFSGFRALLNDGTAQSPRPLSSVDSTFLVDVDTSPQTLGKKIQRAKQMKYNLIFILGPRDVAEGGVTVDVTGQMHSKTDKEGAQLQALIKAKLGDDALQNPRAVKLCVDDVHPLLVELEKNFV
jgi:threonyl-tRNA synthetase